MEQAYQTLYNVVLTILGILVFFCLFRSIIGPRIADRVVAVNMVGTMIITIIAILALALDQAALVDVSLVYTMLSFLAVIVLTKVYVGVYLQKHTKKQEDKEDA